jgi:ABC-type antimicrobial peptide transport system permease subunit
MNRINLIIRKLWNNKLFTFLNIIGLAIGISACWIVFRLVNYELSFDKNHPEPDKIFKVYGVFDEVGSTDYFDGVPIPLAKFIKENLSNVELTVPVNQRYVPKIINSEHPNEPLKFEDQEQIIETTDDYFKMVPYTWLAGNPEKALKHPNEVVLTESRANLYFPNVPVKDLVGKTLLYDTTLFSVAGVVKDLEHPSSFLSKEFIKISNNEWNSDNWLMFNSNYNLFVKLKDVKSKKTFVNQISKKIFDMTDKDFRESNFKARAEVTPLTEVHFDKRLQNSTNINLIYGFIGIGLFLLLLATINYINLTTAQVPTRAKEIGIRKTLGEQPFDVTKAFFLETLTITCIALLISWPITKVFEKSFSKILPSDLDTFSDWLPLVLFIICLIAIISIVSSLYPAYLINRVQISEVIKMKGIGKLSLGSISIRKVLIVVQFVIAQVFVIATFIMGIQMKHTMNSDLGFNYNALINIHLPFKKDQNADVDPFVLKEALKKHSQIAGVSLGHLPLSQGHWGNFVETTADTGLVKINVPFKFVDEDYFNLYEIKLLAGRRFSLSDTSTGIILNKIAVQDLGFKSPEEAIGKPVKAYGKDRTITGVTDNFNIKTFHTEKTGVAILTSKYRGQLQDITIKLQNDPKTWKASLAILEKEWKTIYPNAPLEFKFYDQNIREYYETDYRFSKIINLSTSITILLSCLGLIGLVTISTVQRTKEIGIRKVLGSSIAGIVGLLSKDYIKLVLISILVASPIAWWASKKWLDNFVYKVEISWWMFIIPAIATILIAFLTMSFQSLKAAKANPVDSLRDE